MTRIPSTEIVPGQRITFDGLCIDVTCVEPAAEPGFVWVTNANTPRHARIGIAETVLLEHA